MKKNFSFSPNPPITIEQLVAICNEMKGKSRNECFDIGDRNKIARHVVESIRQVLGYADVSMHKRLSPEERNMIADEYENEDVSLYELARRHGIRYNAVRCIITHRGIQIRNPNRWTKRQVATLMYELKKGLSAREIGFSIGKSRKSVLNKIAKLKKDGILANGN